MNNIDNTTQSTPPIQAVPENQPVTPLKTAPKMNLPIIIGVVLTIVIIGAGGYLLGIRKGQNTSFSIPTSSSNQITLTPATQPNPSPIAENSPKLAVFMRKGDIYSLDFTTNKTAKISKTAKVDSPKLSPNGKYVYYFAIDHSTGGFPRYNIFVSDIAGQSEKTFEMGANQYVSKLKWSTDGTLLGMVLFGNDIPGGANYSEKAFIYNTANQEQIALGKINRSNTSNDQYTLEGFCNQLQSTYINFCNEYAKFLNIDRENTFTGNYKRDYYQKSQFTKPGYILTRSEKINSNLVVLEYYTGEPQNSESKWGEGGGSFIPGYDEGVTETYIIILDETTGKLVKEIPLAITSDFVF